MGTINGQAEIKKTADGSHTLFLSSIDENYHSNFGAIQESEHIFINAGLKQCTKNDISILEVGFGTGLNVFLTYLWTQENKNIKINFTTLEKFPVDHEIALQLNYGNILGVKEVYIQLHFSEWDKILKISENFTLEKIKTDFTGYRHRKTYDLIYFDAFSPEKQPEMWTEELFRGIFENCNENAIMVTYCSKGWVKRAMQSAGFKIEKLEGPPGKRQILRATKLTN